MQKKKQENISLVFFNIKYSLLFIFFLNASIYLFVGMYYIFIYCIFTFTVLNIYIFIYTGKIYVVPKLIYFPLLIICNFTQKPWFVV